MIDPDTKPAGRSQADGSTSLPVGERRLDLKGLKCPLPALRTRRTLRGMKPGEALLVACTDPLAAIDIPNLVRETGDALEGDHRDGEVLLFRVRKR